MNVQFFRIPTHDDGRESEALNTFLSGRRIVSIDREFVADGTSSFWAVAVVWTEGATATASKKEARIDYKQILSEEDFRIYAQLREARKTLMEETGYPAFSIFTNHQLASLVHKRVITEPQMQTIDGVGKGKCRDYGPVLSPILQKAFGETTPKTTKSCKKGTSKKPLQAELPVETEGKEP